MTVAVLGAMRPRQWIKNVLVLAAPTASGRLLEAAVAREALASFVAFCLASSAVYLANDVFDREVDARHPVKRHRAVASGQVSVVVALGWAIALAISAIALALVTRVEFGVLIATYLLIFLLYDVWLKHVPVVDISLIATGFVMRAAGGGLATAIPLSSWFLLVAVLGALLVAAGKRRAELALLDQRGPDHTRRVLAAYTASFLSQVQLVALTGSLLGYGLWAIDRTTNDPDVHAGLLHASWVPFGVALLRYLYAVDRGQGEAPEDLLLRDPLLRVAAVAWAALFAASVL